MLEVASAAGDALPCLFLQANDNEATQELVGGFALTVFCSLCHICALAALGRHLGGAGPSGQ